MWFASNLVKAKVEAKAEKFIKKGPALEMPRAGPFGNGLLDAY